MVKIVYSFRDFNDYFVIQCFTRFTTNLLGLEALESLLFFHFFLCYTNECETFYFLMQLMLV